VKYKQHHNDCHQNKYKTTNKTAGGMLSCLFSTKYNIESKQEGWLSPTERASVSAISLRHIIWLLQESHGRIIVVFSRFAGRGIWLRQESLRHIFASPGYAPGIIVVSVTRMERGLNACQTHRSMYPSIFYRLRAIARYWSEIATFSYPLYLTPPLGMFPSEFRENVWTSQN